MRTFIVLCSLLILGSCDKGPELDTVPRIEFMSISTQDVPNFTNAVQVTVKYFDQDGDLGSPDPDENTVRVKDDRLPDYDWYHLQPLTPDLQALNIEGSFVLELNPLFILGNGDEEVTKFTIQVRDRAGNWSNQISTPQVRIVGEE